MSHTEWGLSVEATENKMCVYDCTGVSHSIVRLLLTAQPQG